MVRAKLDSPELLSSSKEPERTRRLEWSERTTFCNFFFVEFSDGGCCWRLYPRPRPQGAGEMALAATQVSDFSKATNTCASVALVDGLSGPEKPIIVPVLVPPEMEIS